MTAELPIKAHIENLWISTHETGGSYCYFCRPSAYPPMPEGHTLCSYCGQVIIIPFSDPENGSMFMCPPCQIEVEKP